MTIIARRYWNSNGFAVAAVAVQGYCDDWAAYIGATNDLMSETETIVEVAEHGAKLGEKEARALMPEVSDDLAYRW